MIGDTKELTNEEIQEGNVIKTDPEAGRNAKRRNANYYH